MQRALALPMADLEDALQAAATQVAKLNAVVTRNGSDFKGCVVPALVLLDFLNAFGAQVKVDPGRLAWLA